MLLIRLVGDAQLIRPNPETVARFVTIQTLSDARRYWQRHIAPDNSQSRTAIHLDWLDIQEAHRRLAYKLGDKLILRQAVNLLRRAHLLEDAPSQDGDPIAQC